MAYVIKRYSKRKLYDAQESRYVTLEELEGLVRSGKAISVVDVATGEDLTSVTLAEIILEGPGPSALGESSPLSLARNSRASCTVFGLVPGFASIKRRLCRSS